VCSQREIQRGDEVAWYADGDGTVRSELNPSTGYAFGIRTQHDPANYSVVLVMFVNVV
jgi:hypothetical protein